MGGTLLKKERADRRGGTRRLSKQPSGRHVDESASARHHRPRDDSRRPTARWPGAYCRADVYQGDEDVYRALEAGAATCLFKDTLSKDLIRVIREVCAGGSPVEPHVKALLDQRTRTPALTAREVEIVKLVAEGMRNRENRRRAPRARGDRRRAPAQHLREAERQRSDLGGQRLVAPRDHPHRLNGRSGPAHSQDRALPRSHEATKRILGFETFVPPYLRGDLTRMMRTRRQRRSAAPSGTGYC